MSFRWTETLAEPLPSIARQADWRRIDAAKDGGWFLLSDAAEEDVCWFRVLADERVPVPFDPLEDDGLPQLGSVVQDWLRRGCVVHLLAWRVRRRAIFRVRCGLGSRVCKIYRKDRQLLKRWTALDAARSDRWRVPRVLAWDAERRLLTMEDCCGVSLNRRWLSGRGESSDGDSVADVLGWLSEAPIPDGFPEHGAADEIGLLERRMLEFEHVLEDQPPGIRELQQRVVEALRSDPVLPPTFCHRDFHDKQILLDGNGGTLIDLDLAAAGPPALDPGNILAHLRLRALKGARLPWQEIAQRVASECMGSRRIEDSLHRWTAAALMRLALIYSRRRRPAHLLEDLCKATDQALKREGEWNAILRPVAGGSAIAGESI